MTAAPHPLAMERRVNEPEPQPPPFDPFFFYWKTWQKVLLVACIMITLIVLAIFISVRVYQNGHLGTGQ
jgi:hypothetical protein